MLKKTLLMGEPMGLFIAQNKGALEDVSGYTMAVAGAELNVAIGLKRLGHDAALLTKLGNDPFGKRVVKVMRENYLSTALVFHTDKKNTGFMLKSMVDEGDPEIYYYRKNSAAATLSREDVEYLDLSGYDYLHITGITLALSDSIRAATRILWEKAALSGMKISFDPNLRLQLWKDKNEMIQLINEMAGKSDLFMPGINEARILIDEEKPERIADKYLKMGAKTVVVKLGAAGAYYACAKASGYVEGFPVRRIVDTVGAGDGFAAGVLSALKEEQPLIEAVRRGNAVGAIQIISRGDNDGLPSRKELEAFMRGEAVDIFE